jgi:hypothetical protein
LLVGQVKAMRSILDLLLESGLVSREDYVARVRSNRTG